MAVFSRDPREHWLKQHFSKNEVANSGYTKNRAKSPAAAPEFSVVDAEFRALRPESRFAILSSFDCETAVILQER